MCFRKITQWQNGKEIGRERDPSLGSFVADSPGKNRAAGAEGGAGRMPREKQMGEDTSHLERITAFFFLNENIQTYTRGEKIV